MRRIIVVGASAAGLSAIETLRSEGYGGELIVLGKEARRPYDRPPLTKQLLSGGWEIDRLMLRPDAELDRLGADWRLGCAATALDLAHKSISLGSGEKLPYDGLIIATGVQPRRLGGTARIRGVHTLRTIDDIVALQAELTQRPRVVVIGTGVLGTEFAASARGLGLDVTMIGDLPLPLTVFGEVVGERLKVLHIANGVDLRLGVSVAAIESRDGAVRGVTLSDGTFCDAAIVIIAIGSVPSTSWLAGSGLSLGDGIDCDAYCCAAPDVFAAGDVARWRHIGYRRSLRIEHRMNATEQGAAAARNLLGRREAFTPIPFMWSDQYQVKLQAYGIFPAGASFRREPAETGAAVTDKSIVTCHHDGRMVGAIGWNAVKDLRAYKQRLGEELQRAL